MLNGEGTGAEGPGAGSAPTGAAGELGGTGHTHTSQFSPLLAPKRNPKTPNLGFSLRAAVVTCFKRNRVFWESHPDSAVTPDTPGNGTWKRGCV